METLKKIPEYNVEYSIEMAYYVNDVAIKSYDIKKDDAALRNDGGVDGGDPEEEPKAPKADPMVIDSIKVKHVMRPAIAPDDCSRSESRLSKSSRKSTVKASRTKTKMHIEIQPGSRDGKNSVNAPSPLSVAKGDSSPKKGASG